MYFIKLLKSKYYDLFEKLNAEALINLIRFGNLIFGKLFL